MVARNEHTGDKIQTKETTQKYRDGWEAIFGKAGYSKPCCGGSTSCTALCEREKSFDSSGNLIYKQEEESSKP